MISAPDDYGLTAAQTLAHECTAAPPDRFELFWKEFRDEVLLLSPRIKWPREPGAHEVELRSIRDVRVVAQVTIPDRPAHGAVITTHGSSTPDVFSAESNAWRDRPLIVVELRVRGYPPSVRDIDDLRTDWITHGIDVPEAWILRGAIADVAHACRCVRTNLSPAQMLTLHGESLGGGLAVIAASQLAQLSEPVDRMVLGLPTFGDWAWRVDHYCHGMGALVNAAAELRRGADREMFVENLTIFDAAIHGRAVSSPVLCKLAELDDVVPAPAAATVFNALATPADRKLRFVTRYGHFGGGLADLRRHALFERIHPKFAEPGENVDEFAAELRHVQTALP